MNNSVSTKVSGIIDAVRTRGDAAIEEIAQSLGDRKFLQLAVDSTEVQEACARLSATTRDTIDFAAANIRRFAEAIMSTAVPVQLQFNGYSAGMSFRAVSRVACYVPAGRYPLPSTALMTAITAQVAGVPEVYLLSPMLSDEIIYAGTIAGVTKFIQIGGAQAVAAAAFGTGSVPRADMIVGPGNAFVTEAKRQLLGTIGIDMLAGPSEVAIIADDTADAKWLALDMLSQAEHDPEARCYLITDSAPLAIRVAAAIRAEVRGGSTELPPFIQEQLAEGSIIVAEDLSECAVISNRIAPEHLVLAVQEAESIRPLLTNYGALFIGKNATVPFGDYVAGPNHTLPTGGTARFSGGLTPLTFLRTQTWLDVPAPNAELCKYTAEFASIEGLFAHKAAASIRGQDLVRSIP